MRLCYDCGSLFPAANDECPRCGERTQGVADPLIGAVFIDKYRLEEKLGAGGMCDVYRARHVAIGKAVAIKVLRPEFAADPQVVERFEGEARAASLVRHPNAIDVMDYGIADGNTPFMVMELIQGETVRGLLKRSGGMTIERVAGILNQACAALEAAHSVGVIHRDIKPENILVSELDGRDWVEVVDFGIAKIQEDVSRRAALTGANLIIGTPRYMSPEQAEEKAVDSRSDIYSLAVVVYEMLAGTPPFVGGTATRLLIAHAVEPPPPLAGLRPDIPPEVAAVVMRALEKDPDRRPQSALEFAREFEAAVDRARQPDGQPGEVRPAAAGEGPLQGSTPLPRADAAGVTVSDLDEATLVRRRARAGATSPMAEPSLPPANEPRPPSPLKEDRPFAPASAGAKGAGRRRRRQALALVAALSVLLLAGVLAIFLGGDRSTAGMSSGERAAGRGALTNANVSPTAAPSPTAEAPQVTAAPQLPPAPDGKAVKEVRETVARWNASLEARDLNAHMAYYAPRLHTYFLKDNVDRSAARAEVAGTLSRYSKLKIDTSPLAISLDPSGNQAVVTYQKRWQFDGERPWSGAAIERLWLNRSNGRWLIAGVRDLKQVR